MSEPFFRRFSRAIVALVDADLGSLTRGRRAIAYAVRLTREAVRELLGASYLMRAAALAFSTLLALVPLIVVISGVTAGLFPRQSDQVLDRVAALLVPARDGQERALPDAAAGETPALTPAGQQDVLVSARASLRRQLEGIRTHARGINLIGFFVLLYTVLSLLDSIEESMNALWHVRKGRRWLERLPYYIAILFLAPIFMVLSISLTTTLEAVGASAANTWLVPSWARGAPGFLLKHVTPVVLMGVSLWVTYLWMPSAKVRRLPALGAAFVAAAGLEILKQAFLVGAISVVRTNKIYGSLAVLPILFLWLYLSWVIVLCGAAVAFVAQNFEDLTRKAERIRRGTQSRVYYALRVVLEVAQRFRAGASPRIVPDLVRDLDLPEYVVSGLCAELAEKRVLTGVAGDPEAFVPARSLRTLTAREIVRAAGEPDLTVPVSASSSAHEAVAGLLTRLSEARDAAAPGTIADLLDGAESEGR